MLEADIERAVTAIRSELAGWCVIADEPLGRVLLAGGGRLVRHSHLLSRDLRADPATHAGPLPAGLELTPANRPPADLVPAFRAAFPPEHVDGADPRRQGPGATSSRPFSNAAPAGPLLPCSRLAVDAGGTVHAATIITDLEGEPPFGGPWVASASATASRATPAPAARCSSTRCCRRRATGTVPSASRSPHGNRARELYLDARLPRASSRR